jgi:hypothetical protein
MEVFPHFMYPSPLENSEKIASLKFKEGVLQVHIFKEDWQSDRILNTSNLIWNETVQGSTIEFSFET